MHWKTKEVLKYASSCPAQGMALHMEYQLFSRKLCLAKTEICAALTQQYMGEC